MQIKILSKCYQVSKDKNICYRIELGFENVGHSMKSFDLKELL